VVIVLKLYACCKEWGNIATVRTEHMFWVVYFTAVLSTVHKSYTVRLLCKAH
jgi:hypothetical protein